MPWLMREAEAVLDEKILARMLLDGMKDYYHFMVSIDLMLFFFF